MFVLRRIESAVDEQDSFRVGGNGEGYCPVGLVGHHVAGGQNNDLIRIGGARVVGFGAVDNDSVRPFFHNPQVEVRIFCLPGRHTRFPLTSVCAQTSARSSLNLLHEFDKIFIIARSVLLIGVITGDRQGVQSIDTHATLDTAADFLAIQARHLLLVQ